MAVDKQLVTGKKPVADKHLIDKKLAASK